MLLLKGAGLLSEAADLRPGDKRTWLAGSSGLLIGALKARYLFARAGRKNLARIEALEQPRLWQFYRAGFFLFLALMITLGITLSRLAQGKFALLIGVGTLDLSLAVALLGSGHIYWRVCSQRPPIP